MIDSNSRYVRSKPVGIRMTPLDNIS